jgi:hypothetical protein
MGTLSVIKETQSLGYTCVSCRVICFIFQCSAYGDGFLSCRRHAAMNASGADGNFGGM